MEEDHEEKLLAQSLLIASAKHDVNAVRNLLKNASAKVQDAETGYTPLHAAIAACDPNATDRIAGALDKPIDEDQVVEIVRLLLDSGAIWNDLDQNNETPGCIAFRLKLLKVYDLIVAAGIRAELLLDKLQALDGDDEMDEDDEDQDDQEGMEVTTEDASNTATNGANGTDSDVPVTAPASAAPPSTTEPPEDYIDHWDSNTSFLRSSLVFTDTQLLDSSSNAVMMDWETEIMARHATTLIPGPGLRVMNVGHGMGIVDTEIQKHAPAEHHIIEAHPAVLKSMREKGWFEKPGVRVHEGRWQDVVPKLVAEGVVLDALYYDTFAEEYAALRDFFNEAVIGLMDSAGRFGFYHGLGADRQVCYDVYTKVVELDLMDAGLETEWEEIPVPTIEWEGVRRSYWNVDIYRLPVCKFVG
ncbi:Protein arginine N-methyltransferase 2 [Sphaceloma murrayae]|uniref:Arginine N-methyltransferase 2 n=1 Tax=Sphaceloma murrayae TaxID=2082308 RepID=A0A2K1QQ22_9PEZI|nr:Protein arginine N-methyltransferase 2 [Sphaceloma murrayae]